MKLSAKRREPCQRCAHNKADHVNAGHFGTGRCKRCECKAYHAAPAENPGRKPAGVIAINKWVKLPGNAGAVRLRQAGAGRVLEYRGKAK